MRSARRPALAACLAASLWSCTPYPALSAADPAPVAILDAAPSKARADRVVIVSIDGLRPDAIDAAGAETLSRLIERGAYCASARTIRPSVTLPSHTSMLTGLDAERHQVYWNSYHSGYLPYPTVFSVVAQCGGESAMLFSKDKFYFLANPKCVAFVYGPPPPDRAPPPEDYRDPEQQETLLQRQRDAALHPDERHTTADDLARVFSSAWPAKPYAVTFLHFREADEKGHRRGWMSPDYLEALRGIDRALSAVVATIEKHGGFGKTALIVTADHGGSGRDHYWFFIPNKPEHMTIPWICVGPGVPEGLKIARAVSITDTAPTALALLGLGAPVGIEGKAVEEVLR
jgi:predicted AlkP superfamily pyrophosphatase or phosphodiesterase